MGHTSYREGPGYPEPDLHMQAPPRHRPTSDTPKERLPFRIPKGPLWPLLLALTIGVCSVLVALLLLPLFGAVGVGAKALEKRLTAAGANFTRIPHFPQRSTIYARDGSVLATLFLDENRTIVHLDKVSQHAQDAVLAIEDHNFYEHGAINVSSVIRAMLANLIAGHVTQGGSTLTQQLVKNAVIQSDAQTFARKFQEAALAIRLEQTYSKDKILELYMNEVYFGNGIYGIGTAARYYFNEPASKLDLAQSALLAGLIQSPATFDPMTHPDAALARRNEVLDHMAEYGLALPGKVTKVKLTPIRLATDIGQQAQKVQPFFVHYINELILDKTNHAFDAFGKTHAQRVHTLFQGGLKIYTTLDPAWQRVRTGGRQRESEHRPEDGPRCLAGVGRPHERGHPRDALGEELPQGSARPRLAWSPAGGVGFQAVHPGRCVRAGIPSGQGLRLAVSVLLAAVDQRGSLREQRRRRGRRLRRPVDGYAELDQRGVRAAGTRRRPAEHRRRRTQDGDHGAARRRAGDHARHRGGVNAGHGVRVLDAREQRHLLRAVRGRPCPAAQRNEALPASSDVRPSDTGRHSTSDHGDAPTRDLLWDGPGLRLGLGRPEAGKTGTGQDYTNVYFAGYTPQVTTAVWVGFPAGNIPMDSYYGHSVFGGTLAAPIWKAFMLKAVAGMPIEGFPAPPPQQSGAIPDVVGMHSAEAQKTLVTANFTPIIEKVDSILPVNTVIAQTPAGGTSAVLGSGVTLSVSTGKGVAVTVPRVTGLTEAQAVKALDKAGLKAAIVYADVTDPAQDGLVLSQSPIGNKQATKGDTVTITIGKLKAKAPAMPRRRR